MALSVCTSHLIRNLAISFDSPLLSHFTLFPLPLSFPSGNIVSLPVHVFILSFCSHALLWNLSTLFSHPSNLFFFPFIFSTSWFLLIFSIFPHFLPYLFPLHSPFSGFPQSSLSRYESWSCPCSSFREFEFTWDSVRPFLKCGAEDNEMGKKYQILLN